MPIAYGTGAAGASRPLEILATVDENYLPPLKVMLCSLVINNPGSRVRLHIMHGGIGRPALDRFRRFAGRMGVDVEDRVVGDYLLAGAPVSKRYPLAMYYRLLAPLVMREMSGRLLYLDPDILVINPIHSLFEMDLQGNAFAASYHSGFSQMAAGMNNMRLGTDGEYVNTGVILFDMDAARRLIRVKDIVSCIESMRYSMVLPDQDVFNSLYGSHTLTLDDAVWNYDPRAYSQYLMLSGGVRNMDMVLRTTAILHFCGSNKPWRRKAGTRFGALYHHYMAMTARYDQEPEEGPREGLGDGWPDGE